MKRQLTSILLFSALLVGGASTFVSCTDHESDSEYNTNLSLADAIAKEKQALIDITNTLETKADHAADKDALNARIDANKALIDGLGEKFGDYATLAEAVSASKAYTDQKVEDAKDELTQAIENLRTTDDQARQQLEEALLEKITANGEAIANEADARQQLEDNYDMAFDFLINKNLNGIAINATENPVLGYYNASFIGSQLNLAASYYGTATNPTKNNFAKVEQGEFLNNGDAGKLYVTLNPTDLDPRCITDVKLVDSQGNEAKGFKLGNIENTDKVLTYGVTRAAAETSANGFYAIPVIATDPANDDFSLNKGELKEAAKNIIAKLQNPKETNLNLSQIATTLYSSINNKLKAYTVKATYYLWNPETKKLEKKNAVAAYNTAAFAVKPLSFEFAKDNKNLEKLGMALDKYALPTLSDKLGKIMDALDFQIKNENGKQIKVYSFLTTNNNIYIEQKGNDLVIRDFNNGHWDDATGEWVYKELYTIPNSKLATEPIDNSTWGTVNNYKKKYTTVTWPDGTSHKYWTGLEYIDDVYSEYYNGSTIYVIETTDNTIDDLLVSINDQIGTQLQPVKDAINNAADKWDNAIAPVNNLLHKINGKIADANKLLQPTLLYKSTKTNSWNVVSTLGGKLGTRMTGEGSTVLVATSWTAELLAPAYKKSVYVKGNPAGAKVTLMDGKTPAENFSGSVQKVLFTATKGNYTIVYKAVDYSGVETTKEYNITVE